MRIGLIFPLTDHFGRLYPAVDLRQSLNFNMKTFRTLLFWTHLALGVAAGAVVLVMCVTGVALTYEKQMLEWSDARAYRSVPPSEGARPLPPETLLATVASVRPGAAPIGLTRRADPSAPVTVALEGNGSLLVDGYTGAVFGPPPTGLRGPFRTLTNWHRWLALEGASRSTGKAITGAANLAFLFIVVSGMYLWLPRLWTWVQVRQVVWFRGGLAGKARDFNWHNAIGIWSAIPLAIVVAGAVPISYGWASALVFRLAGEAPPTPPAQAGPAPAGRPGGAGGPGAPGARRGGGERGERREPRPVDTTGLDAAFAAALAEAGEWRSMSVRLAGPPTAPFVVTVDAGYGGQPQYRTTVTVDRATAAVVKREGYADQSAGRQWRTWLRFAHTGEFYGLTGQTVAGVVSAGGAVLVYTGIALTLRRFLAWRRRRTLSREDRRAAA